MINDYDICFHIGYPKSASTSLQLNLFTSHSEINFISKYKSEFKFLYKDLKFKKSIDLHLQGLISNCIVPNLKINKINVFSDEGLLNEFHDHVIDNKTKALKIQNYFPNAKIIIVIRNQADLLRSRYDFSVPNHSVNTWLKQKLNKYYQNGDRYLDSLKFDKIIELYYELFGKDKVKVLLYEDLKYYPDNFASQIADFLGISKKEAILALHQNQPKNTYKEHKLSNEKKLRQIRNIFLPKHFSLSKYLPSHIFKHIRKLIYKILNIIPRKTNQKSNINSENLRKINQLYNESNTNLQKLISVDLNKYNYPLTSQREN